MNPDSPGSRARTLAGWRNGLFAAALLAPLGLFFLFERQAKRLDALADHGQSTDAYVTAVSTANGTTFYAYSVDGIEHTWDVARREAPFERGQVFTVTYLPETPSFSLPISDRGLAREKAAANRSFAMKVEMGLAAALALFGGLLHLDVRRLRSGAPLGPPDAKTQRRRLVAMGLVFLPLLVLITGFHLRDAIEKGESVAPVVIATVLVLGIIGFVFWFAMREGPEKVRERVSRIMRWAAPLAIGAALLRLLALLFTK